MLKIYKTYSEKEFNFDNKTEYHNELEFYKNNSHPYLIQKLDNYQKGDKYYIKYEKISNLNNNYIINTNFIIQICNFLKFLHNLKIDYKCLHKNTIFIDKYNLKFTLNSDLIYYDNNYVKNNTNKDFCPENDIYMIGILLYELYYNCKLKIKNNKIKTSFKNYNFETAYINRIIENCLFNNPSLTNIISDKVCNMFSHRLYEISEIKEALYYEIYMNNENKALYWASELFGVGLQKDIIIILLKFMTFEIGIIYRDLPLYFYDKINNFFQENHRKRKQILVSLIMLFCKLKKNKFIYNIYYLSYKNILSEDLKKNYEIDYIFSLNEISIIKYIRILILKGMKYKIWNHIISFDNSIRTLYYLDNNYNNDYLIFLAYILYQRKSEFLCFKPVINIKDNKIKYFGFNLRRHQEGIPKVAININCYRGKPDIGLKNTYLVYSLYEKFKTLNLLHNFTEQEIIDNYGYIEYPYKQIEDRLDIKSNNYFNIENNYSNEVLEYLITIERIYNYFFILPENLNNILLEKNNNHNIIFDKYNLLVLDQLSD